MAALLYSERALDDVGRLAEFLALDLPKDAAETVALIAQALEILQAHPLIGRTTAGNLRELVISRGRTGYVALYEYNPSVDRVLVHAIRHQREAGFDD
jgi:plasmid stabilization system protein ParE